MRYFRYLRYRAGQSPKAGSGYALRIRYRPAPSATRPAARSPGPVAAPSATATPIRYLDRAPDQGGSGGSGSSGYGTKGLQSMAPLDQNRREDGGMSVRTRDEKLTIKEVLADLKVAPATFYRWRQLGKAPRSIKLPNGDVRIRRSEYERWLAEREDAA
ncbi:hypothetical protein GCM10010270_53000 [Streptomyces violaceus]|nr:hypothetical protein GCM10010270_53000 [Streptomyces janthinus]